MYAKDGMTIQVQSCLGKQKQTMSNFCTFKVTSQNLSATICRKSVFFHCLQNHKWSIFCNLHGLLNSLFFSHSCFRISRFTRLLVFTLEVAMGTMPRNVEQFVLLFDASKLTSLHLTSLHFLLSVLLVLGTKPSEQLSSTFTFTFKNVTLSPT